METSNPREERGRQIARGGKIKRLGKRYAVPSQNSSESAGYLVDLTKAHCTCPDHETRRVKCKHQHAVEFTILWSQTQDADGNVTEMVAIQRKTYAQNWPAYNAAQVNEQEHVERLLRALCDGIVEPARGKGRPRLPLGDLVYSAVLKVYGTMSGRRAQSDLRNCQAKGHVAAAPSYNSIFRAFESPTLTPILKALIEEAASPLRSVERQFAQDSTGFSTTTYERWFDQKHGKLCSQRPFVKLHAFIGTHTNVVTSAEVTDSGDCPMLPAMLDATVKAGFNVEEVSADKAYLSKVNVAAIRAVGATPYIPFKENSTGKGPELWREMFAFYMLRRPEFLEHYHRRSNVETTFSMIKMKFGAGVRSKLPVAQENEVLAKVLCHNLCCLVGSIYETGLKPAFWTEQRLVA
jgi:transposase